MSDEPMKPWTAVRLLSALSVALDSDSDIRVAITIARKGSMVASIIETEETAQQTLRSFAEAVGN